MEDYSLFILLLITVYALVQYHHFTSGYGLVREIYTRIRKNKKWISKKNLKNYACYMLMMMSLFFISLEPQSMYFLWLCSISFWLYENIWERELSDKPVASLCGFIFSMVTLNFIFFYVHVYTVVLSVQSYYTVYLGMFVFQVVNTLSVVWYVKALSKDMDNVLLAMLVVLVGIALMSVSSYFIIGIVKVFQYKPEEILVDLDVSNSFVWLSFVAYGIKESSNICINYKEAGQMLESLFAYALSSFNMGISGAIMISFFANNIFMNDKHCCADKSLTYSNKFKATREKEP